MEEEKFTIDNLYTNKIKDLKIDETKYIEKYKQKINDISNNILNLDDEEEINHQKKIILKYENKIKKKINNINNYLLENSNDLFNYFQIKKNIENNNNPKKLIHNFFNKNKTNEILNNDKCNECIELYMKKNHFEIFHNLYNDNNNNNNNEKCMNCKNGELIQSSYDGIVICNKCYAIYKYLICNDKPSYKEPPKEISFYAYRRINHFKEILAQFQAKETTDIPAEIIQNIKNQIKKERIELLTLTNKQTKEILKKLGYNKYYEHIPFIKDKLGIKPPIMSPQLEETLCNLFIDIQIPYAKFCPTDRVNFLNYYYTLYKLCELLGETTYLPHFPMLKEQKKVEQDEIWKKICKELDWDYIPTL